METVGQESGAFPTEEQHGNQTSRDLHLDISIARVHDREVLPWLERTVCVEKRDCLPGWSAVRLGESRCLAAQFDCDPMVTTVITTAGGRKSLSFVGKEGYCSIHTKKTLCRKIY